MPVKPETSDGIIDFDDLVLVQEKKIIESLEKEVRVKCPFLKKEGKFFYYCGLNILERENKQPVPGDPVYDRHVSSIELQAYCMGAFEACCSYS